MTKPASRGQPTRRRSELERLLDLTILDPTHPALGTCWRFTGTTTPYGRMAKARDSYTHRLGERQRARQDQAATEGAGPSALVDRP